jgi:HAD superfamily hydrolase (TIGR01549 family)
MSNFGWLREIRCILLDWGGTLCRNDRERDSILHGIEGIAHVLGVEDESARLSVSAALGTVMQQAQRAADADPEHREIDVPRVLQNWGEQMGFTRRKQWDLPRMVELLWQHWQGGAVHLGKPVPVLEELRRRGYQLGLISNVVAPPAVCHAELQRLGLASLLDSFTFSSEVGVRKPHPAIFRRAMDRACSGGGLEPRQMAYVGDSPRWDVGGAKAAGMRAVLLRSRVADWPESDYETYKPDAIIDRLDELLVLFQPKKAAEG